jgi:FkbM family methyltransferase
VSVTWLAKWNNRLRRATLALAPPAKRLERDFFYRRSHGMSDPVLSRFPLDRRFPGRAIDAGANQGTYTYAFARGFDAVEAFEPQPQCAAAIEAFARSKRKVHVHRLGLSDRRATVALHIPIVHGRFHAHRATGLASIGYISGEVCEVTIDIVPLDDFAFDDVAMIKIDVEGHERQVLAGAQRTITRCRPTLIVEIEQRHLQPAPIADVFAYITSMGYAGSFFRGNELERLEMFSYERDQAPYLDDVASGHAPDAYANNFIFEPLDGSRAPLFASR